MFPQFSYSNSSFFSEPCQLAKHCRFIYPISNNKKSYILFSLIHSDVWGPSPTNFLSGFRYFATFVDDCSCVIWVYMLKHKSDTCVTFKSFHNMVNIQFNTKVQILRSDNGGEYISCELSLFLDTSGIIH